MPSFAPRSEPIKKTEELEKREYELLQAFRKNLSPGKINNAVEKYRKAQLSLLKARIHVAMEKVYQQRLDDYQFEDLKEEIHKWKNKAPDVIIAEVKKTHKFK